VASVLSQIIMRGTIAERPAADTPGRLYFATDESRMYRDNGTTWDEVSPVPGDHGASHALGGEDELLLDPTQIDGTAIVEGDPRLTDAREPLAHAASHELEGADALELDPSQITGTAVVDDDPRLTDAREPLAHAASHGPEGSDPITGVAPAAHAATHQLGGDDELLLDPAQIDGTAAVLADLNGYVDTTTFLNFRSDVFNGLIGSASASSEGPTVSDFEDSEVVRDFSEDADQWQTLGTFSGIAGWPDPTVLANIIIHFNKLDEGTADLEVRMVYDTAAGDPLAFSLSTDYRSLLVSVSDAELLNGGTDLEIQWRLQDPFDSYTGTISSNYRSIDVWTGYLPIYGDQRGAANGVASLDGDGLVPFDQLSIGIATPIQQNEAVPATVWTETIERTLAAVNPPTAIVNPYEYLNDPIYAFDLPEETRDFSLGTSDILLTAHSSGASAATWASIGYPIAGQWFIDISATAEFPDAGENPIQFTAEIRDTDGSGALLGSRSTFFPGRDFIAGGRYLVALPPLLPVHFENRPVEVDDQQDYHFGLLWGGNGLSSPFTEFDGTLTVHGVYFKRWNGQAGAGIEDPRFTDARTPLAHAASHEDGGSDELELAPSQITGTAIVESVFAAKGDLLSASADNTPALLTVGTDGQILMANSAQTSGLEWVDNHAEQLRLTVKNMSGASIAKGKAVYINGVSGNTPTIVLADASTDATSAYTVGLTGEPIDDGDTGFVITKGIIRNISTIGLTGGAPVWLSETAGEITATKPTQPAHGVLIGYAVRIHATVGEIYIFTQNGYELGELHDVLFGTTPVEKNVLSYDATATVWKNRTLADAGIASTAHASTHNAGGSDQMAIDAAAGTGSLRTLGTSSTSAAAGNHTHSSTETINVIIDGGGAAITTGVKADLLIPYAATITAARLLADQSGSIVVDIWKDTYANFPPTVADSITASAKPTLSSAQKSEDTTLTGWTASLVAGDYLRFNVDSATTVQRVTLALTITRAI
jgi:hypothetical protein